MPGSGHSGVLRVVLTVLLCLMGLASAGSAAGPVQSETPAAQLTVHGDYKAAITGFQSSLIKDAGDKSARDGLLTALIETGQYKDAEARILEYLKSPPDPSLLNIQGGLLLEVGRYQEAAAAFDHAARGAAGKDLMRALLGSSRALLEVGKDDDARAQLNRLIDYAGSNASKSAEEFTLIAESLVYLEKVHEANDFFIDARQADPTYVPAFVGQGDMFNLKYKYGDAASLFADALKVNPNSVGALLGLAESKEVSSEAEAEAEVQKALAVNPNSARGLAMKARLELSADKIDSAAAALDQALKINPGSIEAMAIKAAAAAYLYDKPAEADAFRARALAVNPRAAKFFDILAHFAIQNRRYFDAVDLERRAVELEPKFWSARTELGIELLRTGNETEGRAELEKAFGGDPFNIWAKNTLDLLDSMRDYRDTSRGPFIIKCAAQDSIAVSGYAAGLLEEAHKKLSERYHFTPQGPIVVEIFPNHEDFAVRSLGLPGLGALGVCFGKVIAMDSPSAREEGHFNWGSTLWHEFTHVITLQMTDYRIPRWFSEGLSVYEERQARPGWGDDWNPMLLSSFTAGRWHKIADLEGGFQHPHGPEDLTIAYFQASQVCEFIADRFGFDAILRMLALYRDKAQTADILMRVTKLSEADFDRAFRDYIETRARPMQAALKTESNVAASLTKEDVIKMLATEDTFALHLRAGHLFRADNDFQNAILHFRRAIELFPYYTGEGNAYDALAEIFEKQGDHKHAAEVMAAHVRYDDNSLPTFKALAALRTRMGDRPGALEALRLSFYDSPFDYAMHSEAGRLSLDERQYARALVEFQVALALDPPNIAEANYNLASAYHLLGKELEAKHAVLRALEAAPSYEKAQELLLKIVGQ